MGRCLRCWHPPVSSGLATGSDVSPWNAVPVGVTCSSAPQPSHLPSVLQLAAAVRRALPGVCPPRRYTCKFGDIEFKYGNQERVTVVNTGHGTMQVRYSSVH